MFLMAFSSLGDQPPAMIPPVKLGLLALGLAGWPLEPEGGTRVSYGAGLVVLPTQVLDQDLSLSQLIDNLLRPVQSSTHTKAPFLSAQSLTLYLD